jgi:hypothetical protein
MKEHNKETGAIIDKNVMELAKLIDKKVQD